MLRHGLNTEYVSISGASPSEDGVMTPEEIKYWSEQEWVLPLNNRQATQLNAMLERARREGAAQAYEDAARIADDVTDTTRLKTNVVLLGRDIAAAIRARAKETKDTKP